MPMIAHLALADEVPVEDFAAKVLAKEAAFASAAGAILAVQRRLSAANPTPTRAEMVAAFDAALAP